MKIKKILKENKYFLLVSVAFLMVLVVVIGSSYAFFRNTLLSKDFVIYTGKLAVDYKEKTNVIDLENLYPMTNEQGKELTAHEFTVTNNGNITARYQVRLELDDTIKNMVPIEYIKLSYSMDDGSYSTPVLLSNLNSSLVFVKNIVIDPNNSNTFGIKLWIDLNAPNDIQGKEFKARIVVDSIQNVDNGYVVDTAPIITLNKTDSGEQDINLKVGDTYTELGVKEIKDDQDILVISDVLKSYEYFDGDNLTVVDSVDTSKKGIYYITYSITDKSNNKASATRIVTVNEWDTIPSIALNGESSITLEETDTYTEDGVTVSDGNKVITLGEVKTSAVGTYIVRYIVIDTNGNLNSVIRTVNVVEATTLYDKIFAHNDLVEATPTLTTSSNNTSDASGLYKSTATNSGDPTYYFRGNVINNYVDFAGFTWRIVRINEDGTVRLIMQDGINDSAVYSFNPNNDDYTYMYYSNSNVENGAKYLLDSWYKTNITNNGHDEKIATGNYYCEQAKVARNNNFATNSNANMTAYDDNYVPNFICEDDLNGYGLIYSNVGLLNYDEIVHAGGFGYIANNNYYLCNGFNNWWLMSTSGFSDTTSRSSVWFVNTDGQIVINSTSDANSLRPVINLKILTKAIGLGTELKPYKIVY